MDLVDIDKVLDELELNEGQTTLNQATNENSTKNIGGDGGGSGTGGNVNIKELTSKEIDDHPNLLMMSKSSAVRNPEIIQNNKVSSMMIGSTSGVNNPPDLDKTNTKRFVGVSQVLSSLDDYCRDVETLHLDISSHMEPVQTLENTTVISCAGPSNQFVKCDLVNVPANNFGQSSVTDSDHENVKHEGYQYLLNNSNSIPSNYCDDDDDDDDDIEDDDDELLNDGKYLATSVSSITTSSPSSFSSGPSPAGSSISDSGSCSLISEEQQQQPIDNNISKEISLSKTSLISNDNAETESDNQNLQNPEIVNSNMKVNDQYELNLNAATIVKDNVKNDDGASGGGGGGGGGGEQCSLDIGMSSSISSCLYNENTLSSLPDGCLSQGFLRNYDQNLSSLSKIITQPTSSRIMNSQSYDIESNNQSLLTSAPDTENYQKNNSPTNEMNENAGELKNPEHKYPNPNNQVHEKNIPITFGSTMDEISDNELDSLLQEIDVELQSQSETSSTIPPQPLVAIESVGITNIEQLDNIIPEHIQSTTIEENCSAIDRTINQSSVNSSANKKCDLAVAGGLSTVIIHKNNTSSENLISSSNLNKKLSITEITQEIDENLQNADSFSQASTIEFTDMRLQTDFVNIEASGGGGGGGVGGGTNIDVPNEINPNDDSDKSNSSNSGTKYTNNDEQIKPVYSELSNEQYPNNTLDNEQQEALIKNQNLQQRPNSLDLPVNQRLTEPTIISDTVNSTAGQTPPPNRSDVNATNTLETLTDSQLQNQPDEIISEISSNPDNLMIDFGRIPPFWIPDSEANSCMQCRLKFSLLKRRHHCRACGQVLCSLCCSQKGKLEFLGDTEVRICVRCHAVMNDRKTGGSSGLLHKYIADGAGGGVNDSELLSDETGAVALASNDDQLICNDVNGDLIRSPNPNNPMEYCSMIPPYQQVEQPHDQPISVMVPVGVLKREGATPKNPRKDKNVIFSDGIRPGCDLADLDNSWDDVKTANTRKSSKFQVSSITGNSSRINKNRRPSPICNENDSFIPKEVNGLPPIYCKKNADYEYKEVENNLQLIERLQTEMLRFAVQRNFYVYVKIVMLKCCINKTIINFTTFGMHHVGQDEIVILLEMNSSNLLPKDVFVHLNEIYRDADKGHPITELGFSMPKQSNFLGSKEHGGFLFIRSTFQCLQEIYLPESPFLIGILIHRWEVPWAKIFPLRLMLRLGAQYRYYPSPHISIRERNSVYAEIAQTIINFLADFRNYSYTLATIKGMYIHMEDRKTSILIPKNRYDQIVKALNNSSDHILALGGNFSRKADGHLVCIQNMESDCPDSHTYSTQAINIQGQPRKVTGASFVVLNGALKKTSGLSGKCSIVEDGLMVQILPQKMQSIRTALNNMKDIDIICGPVDADETQTELVCIKWKDNDVEFNIGVDSAIDGKKMDGIPSIRVHSGFNYTNGNHLIRWTEVFLIQSDDESSHGKDPIDISKLSEQIARSTSIALLPFLDLLATSGSIKLGLRITLHQDNVCFEAGSQNNKMAPLYMNALDNELIPILHKNTTSLEIDTPIILELVFHILDT